jgi:hypothetical protein
MDSLNKKTENKVAEKENISMDSTKKWWKFWE